MSKNYAVKIIVDDTHTVYLSKEVAKYYKDRGQRTPYIISDIEKMLDEYDIVDYSELYLDIDEDGEGWVLSVKD